MVGETVNAVPLPTDVPPHEPVYQYQSAPVPNEPPVSVSVTVVPEQIVDEGFAVIEVGEVDNVFTMIVIFTHAVVLQMPSALT